MNYSRSGLGAGILGDVYDLFVSGTVDIERLDGGIRLQCFNDRAGLVRRVSTPGSHF